MPTKAFAVQAESRVARDDESEVENRLTQRANWQCHADRSQHRQTPLSAHEAGVEPSGRQRIEDLLGLFFSPKLQH